MDSADTAAFHCLNCDASMRKDQAFCAHCGQKVGHPGLTMHEIGHDLLHALAHVDRSILSLLRELITGPGRVARRYVDGKRKQYFGPFAFLTIAVAFSSAVISLSHFSIIPTADGSAVPIADSLRRHVNILTLTQVPILAAVCWCFFHSTRVKYAESLILAAYTAGLRSIGFALIVVPSWLLFRSPSVWLKVFAVYVVVWGIYFGFAATQFYSQPRGRAWTKGFLATFVAEIFASLLFTVLATAYATYG
jgi:hypothetical protein